MTRAVERVVVVGRDAAAWIAAISLHQAVGRSGVRIEVVELPSLLSAVDVYATLPSIQGLHRLIGLDEGMVLSASNGVPMVGQRFSNWAGAGPPFVHGYDQAAPPGGDLDFVHYWVKGRLEGLKVPLEDFSLAAVAAKQRSVPTACDQGSALSATYGYQLDARGYSNLLRDYAAHLGIGVTSGNLDRVELSEDRISAILLESGQRIEADLFVDASGTEAALISAMPDAAFEPWTEWFPCDRMISASGSMLHPLPAFSQVSAFGSGWTALHPLQNRTAVIAVYDSKSISDAELTKTLPVIARLPIAGEALVTPLRPGIRRQCWIGNCVAIGEAAVSLEPLDAVQLHLTQLCVSYLVTLFPVTADEFPERTAYSAAIRSHAANLRDFQCAHYALNRRFDEPMWDRARDAAVPASLDRKLKLFESRAHSVVYDDETFDGHSWAAIFAGHGLTPKGYDPRVDRLPDEEHIARVQQRLKDIFEIVRGSPRVEEFIATAVRQRELVAQDG